MSISSGATIARARKPSRLPNSRMPSASKPSSGGGVYSHEWGFAKLLYWIRNNPEKRSRFATALEHCDMVAATLIGITDAATAPRSICAMGHKWMWNPRWGGLPSHEFLSPLDPLFTVIRGNLHG